MSEEFSIGEASSFLGVDRSTLRSWDESGKLSAATTAGGHRRYNLKDLQAIKQSMDYATSLPKKMTSVWKQSGYINDQDDPKGDFLTNQLMTSMNGLLSQTFNDYFIRLSSRVWDEIGSKYFCYFGAMTSPTEEIARGNQKISLSMSSKTLNTRIYPSVFDSFDYDKSAHLFYLSMKIAADVDDLIAAEIVENSEVVDNIDSLAFDKTESSRADFYPSGGFSLMVNDGKKPKKLLKSSLDTNFILTSTDGAYYLQSLDLIGEFRENRDFHGTFNAGNGIFLNESIGNRIIVGKKCGINCNWLDGMTHCPHSFQVIDPSSAAEDSRHLSIVWRAGSKIHSRDGKPPFRSIKF